MEVISKERSTYEELLTSFNSFVVEQGTLTHSKTMVIDWAAIQNYNFC